MSFIASENLSAYYELQVRAFTWGGPAGDKKNTFLPGGGKWQPA
jgi:hypothetical protein